MAISHIGPVAAANISAFGGVSKASISAINGVTAGFGGGGGSYAPVTWTDLVNVTESPTGTLTKNVGGSAWNAGAFSVESFAGNGAIKWTLASDPSGKTRMVGVSQTNSSVSYDTIDYGWYCTGTTGYPVEDGAFPTGGATIATNDVLEIIRTGTTVVYKVNGSTHYTSGVSSSGTLYADAAINDSTSIISEVELKDG